MPGIKNVAKPKVPAKPKKRPAGKSKPIAQAAESARKAAVKKPVAKVPVIGSKSKKTQAYTRRPLGTFADLLKKQSELEKIKKGAKDDLRKQYKHHIAESEKIRTQYQTLFNEVLIASVKGKKTSNAKKALSRGYTLEQVKMFIEQVEKGGKVKIPGKNARGIARIKAAYEKSRGKDAMSVLLLLK